MNRAVFIDRDGTINIDYGYVHEIEKFEFIPRVLDALKKLTKTDFKIIIITNQSGIGRDYYKKEDYHKLTEHMLNEFKKNNIKIDAIYHCPHNPDDNCNCRKPNIEMIEKAKKDFNIDTKKSFFIGDRTKDIQCGKNAGCKTILVKTGDAGKEKKYDATPDFIADDLYNAVDLIFSQQK